MSVLVANFILNDGKTNRLEGVMYLHATLFSLSHSLRFDDVELFDSKGKAGAVFAVLGILLLIAGMIGHTTERLKTYQHRLRPISFFCRRTTSWERSFTFVSAEVTITWDRDDVWIGLVDEDEKKRCEDVPNYFASRC